MKTLLYVVGGLVVLFLILGGAIFVLGRAAMQQMVHIGDPAHEKAVAAQIANFRMPPGYDYVGAIDLVGVRTVILTSADGAKQFSLMGSAVPQDIDALASSMGSKMSGCGGMERLPDVRDVLNGKTFVSKVFQCRNKSYRVGLTHAHGRMADTIVTTTAPADGWPSRDLATLLASIHP